MKYIFILPKNKTIIQTLQKYYTNITKKRNICITNNSFLLTINNKKVKITMKKIEKNTSIIIWKKTIIKMTIKTKEKKCQVV